MAHVIKKHFKVTVDGRDFDVVVEELPDSAAGPIGAAPAQRPAAAPVAPSASPVPAAAKTAGPGLVTAPMAGKVLKVAVKVGDKVAAGDTIVVLEAMKMETNVVAATSGTVREVMASEGGSVEAGAPVARIE